MMILKLQKSLLTGCVTMIISARFGLGEKYFLSEGPLQILPSTIKKVRMKCKGKIIKYSTMQYFYLLIISYNCGRS